MKTHNVVFALTLLAFSAFAQESQQPVSLPRIIPTPQYMAGTSESFKLSSRTRIVLGERTTAEDTFAAEQLNVCLAEFKKEPLSVTKEDGLKKMPKGHVFLGSHQGTFARQWMKSHKISWSSELKEEGYLLSVSEEGVVILGESAAGRYYGVMTLVQMLDSQKKGMIVPGVLIRDWPQQKIRGITDDLSRNQVSTMENFKKNHPFSVTP